MTEPHQAPSTAHAPGQHLILHLEAASENDVTDALLHLAAQFPTEVLSTERQERWTILQADLGTGASTESQAPLFRSVRTLPEAGGCFTLVLDSSGPHETKAVLEELAATLQGGDNSPLFERRNGNWNNLQCTYQEHRTP